MVVLMDQGQRCFLENNATMQCLKPVKRTCCWGPGRWWSWPSWTVPSRRLHICFVMLRGEVESFWKFVVCEGDVSRWSSRFSWSWVTQVASWNLITASDQNNNLLSVAKSDVFILQCLVKVFNVMESQNLVRSEAEVQVTAADQENVFPSWWSYERWDVFDFKFFFPRDFCCAFSVSVSCWACYNLLLSWLELQTFNAETVWRMKLHGPGVMFIDSVRRSLTPARCFWIVKVEKASDSSHRFLWQVIQA